MPGKAENKQIIAGNTTTGYSNATGFGAIAHMADMARQAATRYLRCRRTSSISSAATGLASTDLIQDETAALQQLIVFTAPASTPHSAARTQKPQKIESMGLSRIQVRSTRPGPSPTKGGFDPGGGRLGRLGRRRSEMEPEDKEKGMAF